MIQVKEHDEYSDWLSSLTNKEQARVKARITRIEKDEHFGDTRRLGDDLAELRWKNGWRVYFCSIGFKKILLINGGHKNDQDKDIKKARIYLKRVTAP